MRGPLQGVARQLAGAMLVRLGTLSGRANAQLDGFKSRALRCDALQRRQLYTTEWRQVRVAGGAESNMAVIGTDKDMDWRCLTSEPVRHMSARDVYLAQTGSIANLAMRAQQLPARDLVFSEATVDVHATGLNFRDVLNVLGLDPTGMVRPIGGEAAGVIFGVSPACGHVTSSNHVGGLIPGSLRTHAWCDARYIRCMPS